MPVHNAWASTLRCLGSIEQSVGALSAQVIVVDDSSAADTASNIEYVRDQLGFRIIRNDERIGYKRSVLKAMQFAEAEAVAVVNSDTWLPEHSIYRLFRVLNLRPDIGAVGPSSNAAGLQSLPRFTRTLRERLFRQTVINSELTQAAASQVAMKLWGRLGQVVIELSLLHGFLLVARRDLVVETYSYDSDFGSEGFGIEFDLARISKARGLLLGFVPGVYVSHSKSASYGTLRRVLRAGGSLRPDPSMAENLELDRIAREELQEEILDFLEESVFNRALFSEDKSGVVNLLDQVDTRNVAKPSFLE